MKKETEQNITHKKSSRRKYIVAAGLILLLISPVLIFIFLSQNQKFDLASEKVIRKVAAKQLNKDPNKLTDEDFRKINTITLGVGMYPDSSESISKELCDIKLLKKFTNLKWLDLGNISYPADDIPKWMSIIAKLGIFNLEERLALDISPIKKLKDIERLVIHDTSVKDIKPLAGLTNIKLLYLQNAMVYDLEPLKNLVNLKTLFLSGIPISNLEPLKGLTSLQVLEIRNCPNITDEQVEELQKALPDLKIER